MRADLSVQMTEVQAQSETTWCGTELLCVAVQRERQREREKPTERKARERETYRARVRD